MGNAYGYIRQSRRADLGVALSPEEQRRDIATLAQRDGVTVAAVFEDLGRSGGKGKERLRAGYQDLLALLEGGQATTIYTKTLTRLGRSARELFRLLDAAEASGCRIVTMKEGVLDPRTPIGKAQFGMLAVFAEFERDLAVERARDNVAERRVRGEVMGRRPYGDADGQDAQRVLDTFLVAGSFGGTATRLNAEGVPSHLGRKWSAAAVRLVVARRDPGLIPHRPQRGRKSSGGFLFFGLLRCSHDGALLTGSHSSRGTRTIRYKCHRGESDPGHPRPLSIAETAILPWAHEEAARLRPPRDLVALGESQDEARAALYERLDRIRVAFVAGLYRDEAEMLAEKAEVDAGLTRLDLQGRVVSVPAVAWDREAAEVNRTLRTLWGHVQLGADLRPLDADWLLPPSWVAPRTA
jgi:DNA invertase Pin-like site-specific DNA recombinase